MARFPLYVLADDLTGAAEIGGIAAAAGLRVELHCQPLDARSAADVVVFNTSTRLANPAAAARRVRRFLKSIGGPPAGRFFKKTDSLLRGPVLAELHACLDTLGLARALLVPANPALGRTLTNGHYHVDGRPLHQTTLARDPHHPRKSSDAARLLGMHGRHRATCCPLGGKLPAAGVIVGEATAPADLAGWAEATDAATLPAGGAAFFGAWLVRAVPQGRGMPPATLPAGPAVALIGSTAAVPPLAPFVGRALVFSPDVSSAELRSIGTSLATRLRRQGVALVRSPAAIRLGQSAPKRLARNFGVLAAQLVATGACRHFLLSGGETAAAVLRRLGCTRFAVMNAWNSGTTTLAPIGRHDFTVTVKPGSYPWPPALVRAFGRKSALSPKSV